MYSWYSAVQCKVMFSSPTNNIKTDNNEVKHILTANDVGPCSALKLETVGK